MRHNNLQDFEADILFKIVNDVEMELELQPVTGEITEGLLTYLLYGPFLWMGFNCLKATDTSRRLLLSRNVSRLDIRAKGVWRADQNTFFNVF